MIHRRALITGLISFVAAPAIVRATSIMPVRAIELSQWEIFNRAVRDEIMRDMLRHPNIFDDVPSYDAWNAATVTIRTRLPAQAWRTIYDNPKR